MALQAAMVRLKSSYHILNAGTALMSLKPSPSFLKAAALLAFLSLTPVSIYIMYNRTGGPESKKEMTFQKNLRYAFMANSNAVDLAPLTEWPWVRVCAFDAGTSRAEMTAVLGFDYRDYDQMHWLPLKDHWTLLFVDFEREASWGTARPVTPVRIPRHDLANARFPDGAKGVCVPRETGRLVFERGTAPVGASPITAELKDSPLPGEALGSQPGN
jgi:hypothetical protein